MVDGGEEAGGVADVVAQQEHVSLSVGQAAGRVGLQRARGVPDGVPHLPRPDHCVVHVPAERGGQVVLKYLFDQNKIQLDLVRMD